MGLHAATRTQLAAGGAAGRAVGSEQGAMDRLDSLLVVAPVAWLLMSVFVPHAR